MTVEEGILVQIAPRLKRLRERFWAADALASVSYPSAAQAQIASIEDSSFWFRHRNRVIGTVVRGHPPEGPILDVGGGNGSVSLALRRHGISAIVLEPGISGASIAHARGFTVIQASFDGEMFVEGAVPAIGLFDVIEHVADDLKFLRDCRKVLTGGGFLYVTVPALQSLWSSDDRFAGHYRRYNRRSLRQALVASGFEVVALSAFFTLLVPLTFLFRTLPSALGSRKVEGVDKAFDHHRPGQWVGVLMERVLGIEHAILARGHAFPFGTSLIAVARKPEN
jgi:SAM-dependent methyltransferase